MNRRTFLAAVPSALLCGNAFLRSAEDKKPTRPSQLTIGKHTGALLNSFGFDLVRRLGQKPGNLVLSASSIATALAMCAAGAKGDTRAEMLRTLHLDTPEGEPHANMRRWREGIVELAAQKGTDFHEANRIWLRQGERLRAEFARVSETCYGALPAELDFANDPGGAVRAINGWVSKITKAKIPELLTPRDITKATDLVLTNAVYFKSSWESRFDKSKTEKAPFAIDGKKRADVPTMRQKKEFRYVENDSMQAVELPYAGRAASMLLVLPKSGTTVDELLPKLETRRFTQWTQSMRSRKVDLSLPRFRLRWKQNLAETLVKLGMRTPFSASADFSGMLESGGPSRIDSVIHEAVIDVNEEGSEAAAATAVVVVRSAARRPQPVRLRFDRPFLFALRERKNGTNLFFGRVTDPTA